jgi:NAD(P)-dependent dehydrogenase (short-subunit alcohol dehydrogenase family)
VSLTDKRDLQGKVALVTGGASGMGAATAKLLRARGVTVVVADQAPNDGELQLDVMNEAAVDALVANLVEMHGRLDLAANFAGGGGVFAEVADIATADYQHALALNLDGTFYCLRAELRAMLRAGHGSVVNVSSLAGVIGNHSLAPYSAAKHGVVGLTKSAALEVADKGIRVNVVCPGRTLTPMLRKAFDGNEQRYQRMLHDQPMLRFGEPSEVAEAVCWLLSDAASYVTGHALQVDGGVAATT